MQVAARILWIAPSWLGDAVLSLPALRWLQASGVAVDVLARQGTERIFTAGDSPAVVHVVSATRRGQRLVAAWRLRPRAYAAAVVLPPSFSAALGAYAAGAPRRIGEQGGGRAGLLSHPLPPAGRAVHLALAYQRLAVATLAALQTDVMPGGGLPHRQATEAWPGGPLLSASSAEILAAKTLLDPRGIDPSAVLVVAPGARFGAAKRYPAASFARAARAAAARLGVSIVLVGSASDAVATAAVHQLLPDAADLTGCTSLSALIGLLAGARGVLSNDSGVMHLAAALGAPVVGIFGSTNPAWTRPLGPRATYVVHPVPCAPCYRRTCPIDFPCMHGIAPERVVAALQSVLATDHPGVREEVSPL